jgi:hypothetical protein
LESRVYAASVTGESSSPEPPEGGTPERVSHSHADLEKDREIRNELKRRGHNPLMFFLKYLSDDDARLLRLIRDEIKAREWFIRCESPNARSSGWVQQEVVTQLKYPAENIPVSKLREDVGIQPRRF